MYPYYQILYDLKANSGSPIHCFPEFLPYICIHKITGNNQHSPSQRAFWSTSCKHSLKVNHSEGITTPSHPHWYASATGVAQQQTNAPSETTSHNSRCRITSTTLHVMQPTTTSTIVLNSNPGMTMRWRRRCTQMGEHERQCIATVQYLQRKGNTTSDNARA